MVLLIHQKAEKVTKVKYTDGFVVKSSFCTDAIWELAEKYPDEIIAWCEEGLEDKIAFNKWDDIFHHDLIMASYAVENTFLSESIGYVDQMPFINVNRNVLYGTWMMSSDIGGVKGKVLLQFWPLLRKIKNFDYLINSVAKLGQQNSLFCYSAPDLINLKINKISVNLKSSASTTHLFSFIHQHYSSKWTLLLFWFLMKYEKSYPILPMLRAFFKFKLVSQKIDLSQFKIKSSRKINASQSVDIIIPTMGRPEYLYQTLKDFAAQTHLPEKIIIVEQNGERNSVSELAFIEAEKWPFKIIHHFIHRTGACYARNLALSYTTADWVFLSDDDQRFDEVLLENILKEIKRLGTYEITMSYLQPGESKKFKTPKQWGTFGAGNSVIHEKFLKNVRFCNALEHGYGEDKDFGMQLRNVGCDIIYHPGLEIIHLKAATGGFRSNSVAKWEEDQPKPSPTLMTFMLKHYTLQQLRGYKTSLFLNFFSHQEIRNPFVYLRSMETRWKRSEEWSQHLMNSSEKNLNDEIFINKHS